MLATSKVCEGEAKQAILQHLEEIDSLTKLKHRVAYFKAKEAWKSDTARFEIAVVGQGMQDLLNLVVRSIEQECEGAEIKAGKAPRSALARDLQEKLNKAEAKKK